MLCLDLTQTTTVHWTFLSPYVTFYDLSLLIKTLTSVLGSGLFSITQVFCLWWRLSGAVSVGGCSMCPSSGQSLNRHSTFLRVTSRVTTKLENEVVDVGFLCSSAAVASGLVLKSRWVSRILTNIQKVLYELALDSLLMVEMVMLIGFVRFLN